MRTRAWLGCVLTLAGCTAEDAAISADSTGPYRTYPVSSQDAGSTNTLPDIAAANPFVLAESDPFSTFAADVDTASYDIFLRSLQFGTLPAPQEVRVEEYVNYFHYNYPAPAADSDVPFSIVLSAGPHITDAQTKVLRVGIQGAVHEKRPTNLVFLVDISGSMAAENKLPLVKLVLNEALDVLDPTDTVAIVTYAGETAVALEPTPAREQQTIRAVVNSLQPAGGTNGASGIELAYRAASAAFLEDGINHVVLCTDGDFNLGVTSNDELVRLIEQKRKSGVTLTALGVGERNNDAMMERVSNAGNGIYSVLYNSDQAIAYTHQRLLNSMIHVAKDVKIQVEFNPQHVHAYRLLGYEDRAIADVQFRNDVVDAGEIGSGHQVTALFEVALTPEQLPANVTPARGDNPNEPLAREVSAEELVRVRIRYKRPGATEATAAKQVSASLQASEVRDSLSELDGDAAWALGVASLAERLRMSPYAGQLSLQQLTQHLAPLAGSDSARRELVGLLPKVRSALTD